MAGHARLNEFAEDEKYHNLMSWLNCPFHQSEEALTRDPVSVFMHCRTKHYFCLKKYCLKKYKCILASATYTLNQK